jgi:hypothetical protein
MVVIIENTGSFLTASKTIDLGCQIPCQTTNPVQPATFLQRPYQPADHPVESKRSTCP